MTHCVWIQSGSKCLADVCGALHCDLVMDTQSRKTKCNPAAAAKNRHLCEVVPVFVIFHIISMFGRKDWYTAQY